MFSDEQRAYIESDVLTDTKLIACAGSGKTRTVIGRIMHLRSKLDPNTLFAVTFSRVAANDFKTKAKALYPNVNHVLSNYCTIDSLARSFLVKMGSDKANSVELMSVSFRDMLRDASDAQVATMLEHRNIKHIWVDEAQDLNFIQYEILVLLKRRFGTFVHLIGDPNQNIYQFRQSSSEYLLRWEGKEYYLTTNYRSSPEIVRFCEALKPVSHYVSTANKPETGFEPQIIQETENDLRLRVIRFIQSYDKDLSNIAITCPTRGNKDGNSTGLSVFYNLLIRNGIKVNQMYQASGYANDLLDQTRVPGHVNLLTYHNTKGLEFDTVFVMDCHQRLMIKLPTKSDFEDQRCLIYVAASRAIRQLFICGYHNWIMHGWLEMTNPSKAIRFPRDDKEAFSERQETPQLRFKVTELIAGLSAQDMSDINAKMSIKEIFVEQVYDQPMVERGNDPIIFGMFCEQLMYVQYWISHGQRVKPRPLIETIAHGKLIMIKDDFLCREVRKLVSIPGLTWDDLKRADLSQSILTIVNEKCDPTIPLSKHWFASNEFVDIMSRDKHHIKAAYERYLKQSYDTWQEIIDDLFYLVIVEYAYNTCHYYLIANKGETKRYLLENTLLFERIAKHVSNRYYGSFSMQECRSCLFMMSETDIIEKYPGCDEVIIEVKCTSHVTVSHCLQLLLYGFCRKGVTYDRYKIINLLQGKVYSLHIGTNHMNEILDTIRKSKNLGIYHSSIFKPTQEERDMPAVVSYLKYLESEY